MLNPIEFWRPLRLAIVICVLGLPAFAAHADCDDSVKALRSRHLPAGMSFCELQTRYRNAQLRLQQAGIQEPTHIGNAYAPRFIAKDDWTAYLAKYGDSEFAAWKVYDPSPKTWGNWAAGLKVALSSPFEATLLNGSIDDILNEITRLHTTEMNQVLRADRVGKYRVDVAEIIPLRSIHNAYFADDIQNLKHTPYLSFQTGQPIVQFHEIVCRDLPASAHKLDAYYFTLDGSNASERAKSCGIVTMAPQGEVMDQMQKWAAYVQHSLKTLESHPDQIDLLSFVSHVQQWFVLVHPFVDGNGRSSRMMMDVILNHFGLPLPVLDDMNRDFFASADEWATLVGKGMMNAVTAMEECAANPAALGCAMVSETPPVN